jgi:hypothetical protein
LGAAASIAGDDRRDGAAIEEGSRGLVRGEWIADAMTLFSVA